MTFYDFLGHLGFVIIGASFIVRDMMLLRVISILASIISIFYNYAVPSEPLWIVINWNIVFMLVNIVQIILIIKDKRTINFSPEQKELYDTVFKNFSPIEFLKLMRISKWEIAEKEEVLAKEEENLSKIMLIYSGYTSVTVDNKEVTKLKDGDFIGEMSFINDSKASATVTSIQKTKYLSWSKRDLKELMERNPNIKFSMQNVISSELSKKLRKNN